MRSRTEQKRNNSPAEKSTEPSIRLAPALHAIAERYKGLTAFVGMALVLRGWNRAATYQAGMAELIETTGLGRSTIKRALAEMVRRGDLRRFAKDGASNRRNGWGGSGVKYVWTQRFIEAAEALPRTPITTTATDVASDRFHGAPPATQSTRDIVRAAYVQRARARHGDRFSYLEPSADKWDAITIPIEAFATERSRDVVKVAGAIVERYLRRESSALVKNAHPLAWLGGDVVAICAELAAHYDHVSRERDARRHETERVSTPPISSVLRNAHSVLAACAGGAS